MAFDPQNTLVRNPREAATTFWRAPKQRHTFIVRFYPNGAQSGATTISHLTYVAKTVDRPKINIKTEEMHQYNKKRQVYTGFKLETVRMQFFDTAATMMPMWKAYTNYYFGDFNDGAAAYYKYDITGAQFLGQSNGFGFTAANNAATDADGQFYFSKIEIYHFYDSLYDLYQLINPRITQFEPDDLDYENAAVSVISMTVAYEDLQYSLQQSVTGGEFPEFATGAPFNGNVLVIPQTPSTIAQAQANTSTVAVSSATSPLDSFMSSATSTPTIAAPYRNDATTSAGALSTYGSNFSFGSQIIPGTSSAISGAQFDVIQANTDSVLSSQYGTAGSTLTQAALATTPPPLTIGPVAVNNTPLSSSTATGVTLSPATYTAVNTQQTGTAQYGTTTT